MGRREFVLSFVFVCAVIQEVRLAVDERLTDDFFRINKNVAVQTRDIQSRSVTSEDEEVIFFLHTSQTTRKFTAGDKDYFDEFRNFDNPIVFIIHGWLSSQESDWMHDMTDAFLIRDPNSMVILVDWKEPANHILYHLSYIKTHAVSKIINNVLIDLYKNYGIDNKNFLLVGHSLGGQICGFVGKLFQKETLQKLPRLVALDPAGPGFISLPIDERLNRYDAEVVEVIHTDGLKFGFYHACGTIDFFVNGGSHQPGCHVDLSPHLISSIAKLHVACSHLRSWAYFIEAVRNPTDFVSQKCANRVQYMINRCDDEFVSMGDLNTTKIGQFYLETNKDAPYSKKTKGGF